MKIKLFRKMTAVLLALMLVLNFSAGDFGVMAAASETVAAWDCTAVPASAVVPATSGALATVAELTNFKSAIPTYSTGSLSINGWDNGAATKYWQISTGPKEFKVVYSVDNGAIWNDVPNGAYTITGTTLSNYMPAVSLPAGAADAEKLLVRFIMTSNVSQGGAIVGSGGTSNINNILVTGTPVSNASTVGGITAAPANGAVVGIGSKVTLTCDTEGAAIMYSLNNSEFAAYDPIAQVTLTTLPATLKAYGTKAGMTNSVTSTFNYAQGQVAAVTASPN
ncbi:MAG: hypothetical protein K0S75_1236, partial [Clostridia bacterium]|nr:hypothetical protein [Clostridia bacterium]